MSERTNQGAVLLRPKTKKPAIWRGLMLAPFELFNSEVRSSDAFATDLQGISLYVSSGCRKAAPWQLYRQPNKIEVLLNFLLATIAHFIVRVNPSK